MTEAGLKVAFIGDQGLTQASRRALHLVREEDVDLLVLLGDFDYVDRPKAWEGLLDSALGADFPWLAVIGNHDVLHFRGAGGYQARIKAQLAKIREIACSGAPGRNMSCVFRGLHLVLSDVGTLGSRRRSEAFLREELASSTQLWRVCGWHKNQRDMQVGGKRDEVGYGAYRACQSAGALILTGHEHSYARTRALTEVGNRRTNHGAEGEADVVEVGPGRTLVIVSGAGGRSLRTFGPQHSGETWWAAYYTADRELSRGTVRVGDNSQNPAGVLFITFGVDGDPRRARGEFRTVVTPRVIDSFSVVTQ